MLQEPATEMGSDGVGHLLLSFTTAAHAQSQETADKNEMERCCFFHPIGFSFITKAIKPGLERMLSPRQVVEGSGAGPLQHQALICKLNNAKGVFFTTTEKGLMIPEIDKGQLSSPQFRLYILQFIKP